MENRRVFVRVLVVLVWMAVLFAWPVTGAALAADPPAVSEAAAGDVKPLVEVDKATFLVGSKLPGVMTANSKVAYGTEEAAKAAQAANGGELVKFDQALLIA